MVLVDAVGQQTIGLELLGRRPPLALPVEGEPVELADRADGRGLVGELPQHPRRVAEPLVLEVVGRLAQTPLDTLAARRADRPGQLGANLLGQVGGRGGATPTGTPGRTSDDRCFGFVTDLLDAHPLLLGTGGAGGAGLVVASAFVVDRYGRCRSGLLARSPGPAGTAAFGALDGVTPHPTGVRDPLAGGRPQAAAGHAPPRRRCLDRCVVRSGGASTRRALVVTDPGLPAGTRPPRPGTPLIRRGTAAGTRTLAAGRPGRGAPVGARGAATPGLRPAGSAGARAAGAARRRTRPPGSTRPCGGRPATPGAGGARRPLAPGATVPRPGTLGRRSPRPTALRSRRLRSRSLRSRRLGTRTPGRGTAGPAAGGARPLRGRRALPRRPARASAAASRVPGGRRARRRRRHRVNLSGPAEGRSSTVEPELVENDERAPEGALSH